MTQTADKLGIFRECLRVLKPGGTFSGYDWMRSEGEYSEDMRYGFEMEGLSYAMETPASGGFDPARDIEAITVNRWPHGYACSYNPLFDSVDAADEPPHVIGRARFGRIAVANSDAGAQATVDSAIDQAHRAIEDLAPR